MLLRIAKCFNSLPIRSRFVTVFATALAIRLLFLVPYAVSHSRYWGANNQFGLGEIGTIAVNLYEGRGFSSPFGRGSQPTAWECPLVPILWAGIMHLTRGPAGTTARFLTFLQAIPSALSSAMYWLIALALTAKMPRRQWWASSLIGVIFCFWPESILRLTDIWYFVWQELALAILFWCAMKWSEFPTWRAGIIMGITAGALALINITPLPIYFVALLIPFSKKQNVSVLVAALASLIVSGLVVAPWLIRNAIVFQRFVPLRGNIGYQLFEGNNQIESIKETASSPHPGTTRTEKEPYESLGEIEYDRRALRLALTYIRSHPLQSFVRALKRIYVAWLTDIFDQWPYTPGNHWWRGGVYHIALKMITLVTAIGSLCMAIAMALSGRLHKIPHWILFASMFVFVPLPHYFTQIDDSYMYVVRPWLVIASVIALTGITRQREALDHVGCEVHNFPSTA